MTNLFTDREQVKADAVSGLVVFLVALPLCLGIALASGAPILSGLITGIVAGLVVALLSGSELSVSGPAAGLTVIVSSAIARLGSYEIFLTAVVLSGLLQLVLGLLRAGTLSAFFPNSVIHGMLAAIGITIILKQIPHGLGRDTDYEGDLDFWNVTDSENTFSELLLAVQSVSPLAVLTTLLGILLMIYWPTLQKKIKQLEVLPAALFVVLSGIAINELALLLAPSAALDPSHLVTLPAGGLQSLATLAKWPDPALLFKNEIWSAAIAIALVGSVETLLCLEATDKLDPRGRTSDGNRELLAQGVGNILCGFLGGIPMTSVIVRSSTNIYSGGRTRLACMVHGAFLLAAVALLAPFLNRIPLASLAAILCVVGYKLVSPQLVKRVYDSGAGQFIPFIITIVAVIFTDLLTGVGLGLVTSFVLLIKTSTYQAIVMVRDGDAFYIQFTKDVTFSSKAHLRKLLKTIPNGSTVFIDGTRAMFIDHDVYEMIDEFRSKCSAKNIHVELVEVMGKTFKLFTSRERTIYANVSKETAAVQ